ncbi:MAG: SHOCT domain-containing protein [Ginsengibacter sp.]
MMMMWWWLLIPVVFLLVVFLYKGRNRQNNTTMGNPMDILNNRFAKGEISKEEFEEQKRMMNLKN